MYVYKKKMMMMISSTAVLAKNDQNLIKKVVQCNMEQ